MQFNHFFHFIYFLIYSCVTRGAVNTRRFAWEANTKHNFLNFFPHPSHCVRWSLLIKFRRLMAKLGEAISWSSSPGPSGVWTLPDELSFSFSWLSLCISFFSPWHNSRPPHFHCWLCSFPLPIVYLIPRHVFCRARFLCLRQFSTLSQSPFALKIMSGGKISPEVSKPLLKCSEMHQHNQWVTTILSFLIERSNHMQLR